MENLDAIEVLPEVEEVRVPNIVCVRTVASVRPSTKWKKTKRCIYNRETKAIFGRTCADWGRLGLFYLVFNALLAAVFAIGIKVLLSTMDTNAPKWKLEESLIGTNPGLGFRPFSLEDGALIQYSLQNTSTAEKWVKLLDTFLEPYENYTDRDNIQNCTFKIRPKRNHVCMVDLKKFGPCQAQYKYGYGSSSPCIFIKLNRIFKWVPRFYKEEEADLD
ncbi:sodium/potassium-transporting ATPase subunit beta-1-like [Zophobas morio]|uniref:sodium/potassium-transporting ATPase subunit beta-1-like n=1 Tax=Zophobas morio TaxID=2755281 RepID=UPI003083D6F6